MPSSWSRQRRGTGTAVSRIAGADAPRPEPTPHQPGGRAVDRGRRQPRLPRRPSSRVPVCACAAGFPARESLIRPPETNPIRPHAARDVPERPGPRRHQRGETARRSVHRHRRSARAVFQPAGAGPGPGRLLQERTGTGTIPMERPTRPRPRIASPRGRGRRARMPAARPAPRPRAGELGRARRSRSHARCPTRASARTTRCRPSTTRGAEHLPPCRPACR